MANSNFTPKELESEEWRPIKNIEGCEVSSLGRVRSYRYYGSFREPHLVMGTLAKNGYLYVNLTDIPKTIHSYVLETFVGPRPERMEACHNNGIRTNNRLSNLRWDTTKANHRDSVRHGTHNQNGLALGRCPKNLAAAQVSEMRSLASTHTQRQLARRYGLSQATVFDILHRKCWKHID